MDWIGLDWIGLDWVEILEKNDGLDWIGSKVLYIKIFTAIFVRPIIYRYSIFQSACEASGSVQTLVLIILNYLSFSQKKFAFI